MAELQVAKEKGGKKKRKHAKLKEINNNEEL
ncbi:uncharacterized protein G2W53_042983 [Senna tora]|uniref:Uncharacterized protein n=1 Tax=Senna tora TaxID=362788 RepID=A0A834VZY1_9FABA|nr:uncharacterized protein G2W53_042983 [Senna tora]